MSEEFKKREFEQRKCIICKDVWLLRLTNPRFKVFYTCPECNKKSEGKKENWSTKEHIKIDLENAEKIMEEWEGKKDENVR